MSITATIDVNPSTAPGAAAPGRLRAAVIGSSPWIDAGPIATAGRERIFACELERLAGGRRDPHDRRDVTAVLNALRAGLLPGELLDRTPGLRASCLHGAYRTLEEHRRRSARSWRAVMDHPTVEVLVEQHDAAARLMPVLVGRLVDAALIDRSIVARLAGLMAAAVEEAGRASAAVELELDRCVDTGRRLQLSRTLFDPHGDCLFGRAEHFPSRVGSLVPTRVAALLGERELPQAPPAAGRAEPFS